MTASSSAVSEALRPGSVAARAASAAWVSSSRAPNRRLRRATQPSPALSSVADISPLEKVQLEFADAQHRERKHEWHKIIKQPEDQQARQQLLGIELPERDQHGGVEHPESARRMAGEAQQSRGDENHRHIDEL